MSFEAIGLQKQPHDFGDDALVNELLVSRQSKWNVTIVLHLRRDTKRFTALQREIGSISQKALTASLRALERDGIVRRISYATIPPRVDYVLTALGVEALQAFEAFEAFAQRYGRNIVEARRQFDTRLAERLYHPPMMMPVTH